MHWEPGTKAIAEKQLIQLLSLFEVLLILMECLAHGIIAALLDAMHISGA